MSNVEFPPVTVEPLDIQRRPHSSTAIASICYRSKSAGILSSEELDALVQQARARNRRETLTGIMIYDAGTFFQWLEGPPEQLARVWSSICADSRHNEIEVMGRATFPMRFYADWDMQLLSRRTSVRAFSAEAGSVASVACQARSERPPIANVQVDEFARLIIEADPSRAYGMVDELLTERGFDVATCASLFEPTARVLGDLWGADRCSAFDVSLGLSRLTSALRRLDLPGPIAQASSSSGFEVLVAPFPGEEHLLGATLEAEALWQEGYGVNCEFPGNPEDLNRLVSRGGYDALALALSPTFGRQHWVPRIKTLIQAARLASTNPALVVTISGRMYCSPLEAATSVGADAHCGSTREVLSSLGVARAARRQLGRAAGSETTLQ